jgi:peptidoglycan hydrolase CwlO-like protein
MQTFEAQVEGLTSLTITSSSAPTQTELSDFLSDGAAEIINAMPQRLKYLCATEDTFTSTAFGSESEVPTSGQILSVTRVSEPCRQIPAELAGRASDSSAFASSHMETATATDPVWYVYNGKVNALPASGACKYLEVNRPSVAYTHSSMATSLASFPLEYEYLVVTYASIKSLQNAMGNKTSSLPTDVTLPTLSLPSAPVAPSIATVSYTDATNADASIEAIVVPAKIDVSGNAPSFVSPVSPAADFAKVTTYVETDEDVELASSKLQQIQSQISDFSAKMQESTSKFNKDNVRYQMEFQEEVTKVNQDLQAELERFRTKASVAQFNKQQDQSLNLTNAAKQMEDVISDNNGKLQKYSSELQKYQSESSNELQKYQAEVSSEMQNYNAKIQKHVTDYQWLTSQYQQLSNDYQRGLQLLTGTPVQRGQ